MAILKKRTAIAVTAGLWLAAAGSAAALHHHLNRRLDPQAGSETSRSPGCPASAPLAAERVLYVPTIEIVAPWPYVSVRAGVPTPSTPVARDVSAMGCTYSRELDIGSGRVQFCE